VKIAIFTDEVAQSGSWHGAQLQAAFAARNVEVVFVSLQDCVLDLSGDSPSIKIPNFDSLPKAAFVRGISGGTLQQITQRLNILHALKMLGTTVYNDGKAIERTVDKAMTSFLLQQHGIPTPKTWVCESRISAHKIIQKNQSQNHQLNQQLNKNLVIKPLFGSQGAGVRLIERNMLPLPMDSHVDGVFYLQTFIKASHDYRVFVVNSKAVAAMKRTGDTWLHNVAQGAKCENILDKNTEKDVLAIALQAARVLEIDYCGVDVIRDAQGKLFVLEVNSIPAWRGLQSVTEMNVAEILADDFLSKITIE
jgi:tetrahydromethanopterin:alpha-L-glutamate ligase